MGSVLERKKARTNSSKEIVNVSSRLATIPGKTIGKVTLQNVIKAFSQRSIEASSSLLSKPSIREIKISIENGIQSNR